MARAAAPCVISSSIVVEVPIQQCWDLYINNKYLPEWAPTVNEIECDSPTLGVDVIRKCSVTVDGKSGQILEQCTCCDQLKQIKINVMSETFGFSHMLINYGFSALFNADGINTLLIIETHYQPKKIFASLMTSPSTQQQLLGLITDNLESFKQYAERQHQYTPKTS